MKKSLLVLLSIVISTAFIGQGFATSEPRPSGRAKATVRTTARRGARGTREAAGKAAVTGGRGAAGKETASQSQLKEGTTKPDLIWANPPRIQQSAGKNEP